MLTEYEPPVQGQKAVMLMLPRTKAKPHNMSAEHLALNSRLLSISFRPTAEADQTCRGLCGQEPLHQVWTVRGFLRGRRTPCLRDRR